MVSSSPFSFHHTKYCWQLHPLVVMSFSIIYCIIFTLKYLVKLKLGEVLFMSETKVCQNKNIWFGHHPSPFGYFSTSRIKKSTLYVKPKIYFKSIIFIFSFVIFVKLHLGVDLQDKICVQESYLHFSKHSH